ncbi:MAG: PAS domain S-box protein [Thermoplasmata archaeon]|nr:PAS domain S-box protein [Thermoplasmata archaeon]
MREKDILVVEDESIIAADIKACLKKLGYGVVGPVSMGEEAIKIAEEKKPALVLMDIRLKGKMDGIEAAEAIRPLDIPVVYLTSHSDEGTLERAKITEPFGYILKPYEKRELHTNIEMALYKHRSEGRLRESEERFRSVVNTSRDAIVSADSQGTMVDWNPAAEKMFGRPREEALGEPITNLVPLRGREAHARQMVELLSPENKPRNAFESVFMRKDGSEFSVEVSLMAWNAGGKMFSTHIIRDISIRKRVEEERKKIIMELQEALAKMTVAGED